MYISARKRVNFVEKLPTFISVPAYSNSFFFEVARHAVSRTQNLLRTVYGALMLLLSFCILNGCKVLFSQSLASLSSSIIVDMRAR